MELKIEVVQLDWGVKSVRVEGEIDLHTAGKLEKVLMEVIHPRPKALLINLSKTTYLSSSGIEVIMECSADLAGTDSRILIIGAKGMVLETLQLVGVFELSENSSTEAEAVKSLSAKK